MSAGDYILIEIEFFPDLKSGFSNMGIRAIFGVVACMAITIAGMTVLLSGLNWIYNDFKTYTWPSAQGSVLSTDVSSHTEKHRKDGRMIARTYYRPEITYEYTVNRRTYKGDKLTTSEGSGKEEWANEKIKQYSPGRSVDVYYKPGEPSNAILEPGVTWGGILFSIMGLGMMVIGTGIIWIMIKTYAQDQDVHRDDTGAGAEIEA